MLEEYAQRFCKMLLFPLRPSQCVEEEYDVVLLKEKRRDRGDSTSGGIDVAAGRTFLMKTRTCMASLPYTTGIVGRRFSAKTNAGSKLRNSNA